ncbi:MAG: hypothetical protein AAB289_00475 [Chloroflexota bacterium]|mgnify:CR=1
MKKRATLLTDGPFAHDPAGYQKFLVDTVATSTAIEIGPVPPRLIKELKEHSRHPERISFGLK